MISLTMLHRISPVQQLVAITLIALSFPCLNLRAQKPAAVVGSVESGGNVDPNAQQSPDYRFKVETKETATFYVGKQGKFDIVLLDRDGNQVDAPRDLETTITVTTLETLDEASAWLASHKTSPVFNKVSRTRRVTLARGQEASRTKIIHRMGEEDERVLLLSNQPGVLHIFVESQNIATGETSVVVLGTKRAPAGVTQFSDQLPSGVRLIPIAFQDGPAPQLTPATPLSRPPTLKLDIRPSTKPIIQANQGDQIGQFKVILQTANDQLEEASRDISVILQVDEGYAYFKPDKLTIPKGQVITPEQAELRTRPGGLIKVSASTSRTHNITPVSRTYEFSPGVHSTSLSVQKQRESAYANGLDEIELRVAALQGTRAITPEEEGMEERKISFQLIGDSHGVKFENGKSEIAIPKGQTSGAIKLFSVRPVSDLKVVAESWNGLRTQIKSADEVPIHFSFPWVPMLFALFGGVTFPLLANRDRRSLAQGLVVGGIFFILALFGAVLSDPQKVGSVSVNVTKLPTENVIASFALGFVGSVLLGVIFKRNKTPKPA